MQPMIRSTALVYCGALVSCVSTSPAMRSPLEEELAASDTSKVEAVARSCLSKTKWKVDPIGGLSPSGWNIINARKGKKQTEVYIQGPGSHPRITGGPDYDDRFWTCLGKELAPSSEPPEFGR